MAPFTDQKPQIATEEDLKRRWSARKPGEAFRCYLCGHRFQVGDTWRWVYANGTPGSRFGNFLVCPSCDGPDVLERWVKHGQEAKNKYWWLIES
jgi:hypothetical protein